MEIYLLLKDDQDTSTYTPFMISYDSKLSAFTGFYSKKLALLFIELIPNIKDYKPVQISEIPLDKLKNCKKIAFFENENNIYNIFNGKIKTLLMKAKSISKFLPDYI